MNNTRADQFATLAEVSRAVASILDLDTLLRESDFVSLHTLLNEIEGAEQKIEKIQ